VIQTDKTKRVVLLDTHAILHRAYHALPDFSTQAGEPTGALYGLCTMLLKLIETLKPEYIIACFDLPEKTHRHKAYEAYKGTRKKIDDALISQINKSRDIFEAFNIPLYAEPGYEADDLLGTIAEKLKNDDQNDIEIVIASGDMDTLQLVDSKKVQVFTLRKGIKDTVMYDEEEVKNRFGFSPEQLPDYKGLRGDPSDNIIGIAGIGEKTATTLITTFGSIEGIYAALAKPDADEKFKKAGITPRIIELLRNGKEEAIFSKTLATIHRDVPVEFSLPKESWKDGLSLEKLDKLFTELEFRTMLIKVKNLVHPSMLSEESKNIASRVSQSSPTLDFSTQPVVLSGAEKELLVAATVLNYEFANAEISKILEYSHTQNVAGAKEYIFSELKKQNLFRVFEKIEQPLIAILEEMEVTGIKVNTKYLEKLSKEYHKRIKELEGKIIGLAGEVFNVASPKQLGTILFEKLNLKAKNQKKNKSGGYSTKESELEKLKDAHPIIDLILEFRMLSKLTSTYLDTLPSQADENSRIHSKFSQMGAATGRMSSNDPNLQNIPIKTEEGKKIRNAFIAEDGFKLVSFDYSQIELRIAAFLANEPKLIEIFAAGKDIHSGVAARVFKVAEKDVDAEMRRKAKVINFGILYGMGVNALKTNLQSTREEAEYFYKEYFSTFTRLAEYLEEVKVFAKKNGYAETYYGRRRYFPLINSRLPYIASEQERMAINAPIQGTAADVIKLAMISISELIKKEKLEDKVHLLLQVHDELVFEIREDSVKEVCSKIKDSMENVISKSEMHGIPLIVNAKIGENWGETTGM
jgi:DNA polymerase-1